jgi:NAD-dependent SIR2 family protein deacetylase
VHLINPSELSDPQEMFDIHYFKWKPQTFYRFCKELYIGQHQPSPTHKFIKILEEKGKLLRNYTQNIDGLERKCGIERLVQCHGSFATASCIECGYKVPGSTIESNILHSVSFDSHKTVPVCVQCQGVVKPDIVFFGEPIHFHDTFETDRFEVDALLVMGSSLQVAPISHIKGIVCLDCRLDTTTCTTDSSE